jgi:hypothetical protein
VEILAAIPALKAGRITYEEYQQSDTYRYFEMMSEALATMCSDKAYVLTPDPGNIPTDGIWHNTERPTLERQISGNLPQDHGKCNEV